MKIQLIVAGKLKKYEKFAKSCEETEKVWKSSQFCKGHWNSMKIQPILRRTLKSMKIRQVVERKLKKYEDQGNFVKETEKVLKTGKFWQGDWKSIKIWQILTWRLKKYENLAEFYKETKKYENLANFDMETEKLKIWHQMTSKWTKSF